jgi:GH24 family phage-related lysozyme (muramidase)
MFTLAGRLALSQILRHVHACRENIPEHQLDLLASTVYNDGEKNVLTPQIMKPTNGIYV